MPGTLLRSSALPLIAAAVLSVMLAACRGAPADAARAETAAVVSPVRLAPVSREPVSRPIRGTGVVRLKSETDLAFKVGGVVTRVAVDEGASVKKGQVLARIDPVEVTSALRQAEETSIKAERDLERATRLAAMGAIPKMELENAVTFAKLAKAGVDAASFNAERATLVAPDDGRVDRRLVEPGAVVAPGQPVFHVSGRSKGAVVRIGLSDRDALRVRAGDVAQVVLDARPGEPLSGKVSQIATVASPGSGTFDVEIKLDAPPDGLLSGLTAKVILERVDASAVATIPVGALASGQGNEAAIFVVEGDRARRVPVRVAFLTEGLAALASIPDGVERVVEGGALKLEDGAAVRVLP